MRNLPFYSKRKKRAYPESRLQKVIASHLMMAGAFFFAVPNEGQRSPMMAAHLKAMGMLPGCADLCVIVGGRAHFMEVKAEKGTRSENQLAFALLCARYDVPYACVHDIASALKTLSDWQAIHTAKAAA